MPQALPILFGAAFTVAVSLALGTMFLRALHVRLYRQEERALAFVTGSALLSLAVFLLCAAGVARKNVFLFAGAAVLAMAFRFGAHRPAGELFPPLPSASKWLCLALFAPFFILYFFNAMAPEMSPDGSSYHLSLVARYLRGHGFERFTTNMYGNLSQGIEMLFLFAFAFGRHSAAALTHFAFLLALPFSMLCYARRCGFPNAGLWAALLVFASPVAGIDGTSAYNDIATACILFAVFYLTRIWAADPSNGSLLAPIGLTAGFGYAAKYTAFLALPYALAVVAWVAMRRRAPALRALLTVAVCAALQIAPWMIKNTIVVANPVSPFFNRIFPNPYIHISFEKDYAYHQRHYDELKSASQIPLEVTVRGGALGGLLGPVFLLAPLALLALRLPAGRSLLLAALVFGAPYAANVGTRFLLPALPFVALALCLALSGSAALIAALVIAHAVLSWPSVAARYCAPNAWRLLAKIPVRQALRIESEESFLNFRLPYWAVMRLIDRKVPPGGKVFSYGGSPEAYSSRDILVAYESAFGNVLGDILWGPLIPDYQARWILRFQYPAQSLRGVRVVQTAWAAPDLWSVGEFRIFAGKSELPREPGWKLRASPNPWDVQLAFDNSPATRWRSWQAASPGMYLAVEFPSPRVSDAVVIECSHDQYKVRLRLEGLDEAGKWKTLAEAPQPSEGPEPAGLRRAAAEEAKARGVEYLLLYDDDYSAEDFRRNGRMWGVKLLGEQNGGRLYRFE